MRANDWRLVPLMMLLTLVLLTWGCSSVPSRPVVVPPPPLPPEARQPPAPSWCLPTCSAALSRTHGAWLNSPTSAASPGLPASGPTTP